MTLDVSSNKFTLELKSDELVDSRFALCSIRYPEKTIGDTLDEDVQTGRLGDINLSIDGRINSFELSLNTPEEITIDNSLIVEEIRIPVGPDEPFRPCYLDADGDGVVTSEDIERIYSKGSSAGLRFDINNDGIVDDQDRVIAREYIGTICTEGDEDTLQEYPGVYDGRDILWGYSINRLLLGSHSKKPLFRVVMPVNYFIGDFDSPVPAGSNFENLFYDNGRLSPNTTIQNAVLRTGYSNFPNYSPNPVERGELLVKDIFWRGSEDNLREDIVSFYTQAKNIQEANGINPDEDFYTDGDWKMMLNSVRVCIVYDQSGNGKHGYSTSAGNTNGNWSNSSDGLMALPGTEADSQLKFTPMIYSLGRFFEGDGGKISLSNDGYQKDNSNPYGFPDGRVLQTGGIAFSMGNPSASDFQRQFTPNSQPGQPIYQYIVSDFSVAYRGAPFDDFIEGSFNANDVLRKSFEDAFELSSFDDIFKDPEEGKVTDEMLSLLTPSQHIYQYSRAIFALNGLARNINNFRFSTHYREPSGDSISLMGNSYTVWPTLQGNQGDIINPDLTQYGTGDLNGDGEINSQDGETNYIWHLPAWKGTYDKVWLPTQDEVPYTIQWGSNGIALGFRQGVTDMYLRLKNSLSPSASGNYGDYNRKIGSNQWRQNLTVCMSSRLHTGTYPGIDFRVNNKRQIIFSDSSLSASPSFHQPQDIALGQRNCFYELVGFNFETEEDYENVLIESNDYFKCFPQEDSSVLQDPYTQEDLDAYNNG